MEEWRYSHTTTVGRKKSIEVKYYYNKDAQLKKVYSNGKEEIIDKVTKGNGMRIYVTIAKLFPEICGEWFEGCQVDHINCNRNDNRAENLRCCTASQNMQNPLTKQHCKEAAKQRWKDGIYKDSNFSHEAWNKDMKGVIKRGPHSEEWNKRISEARKGYKMTEEQKKKLSEIHKNNPTKYWLGKESPIKGKHLNKNTRHYE